MQPWEMSQTVESGETMFVVIPQNATRPIGKALLPMDGIGKVKTGQRAIIRFPAFPEQEFGFIEGKVVSISPVPDQENKLRKRTAIDKNHQRHSLHSDKREKPT
jgi:multidrug resistance efflux pump